MSDNTLSAKDEALLILEYLENERMSKTFLSFLEESKHLHALRARLYANYESNQPVSPSHEVDREVQDFQTFFNLSKQLVSSQSAFLSNKPPSQLFFDEDFLNDLISQTPPMDYPHQLPETPINQPNEDMHSIEQLFATEHQTSPDQFMQTSPRLTANMPYTKCIVVTQDYLQSMFNPQSTMTTNYINTRSLLSKPKRRRRKLKNGKENYVQQRKIMPRTSPDHP